MDRKEAIAHFRENAAEPGIKRALQQFHEDFKIKRELYCQKLLTGFETMAEKLQTEEPDTEIACIQFSFLQSHVLDGTYQWVIEAKDKNEILDRKEREVYIAMPELFGALETLEQELKQETKKYIGNLNDDDAKQVKLEAFRHCIGYFYLGGYYAFRNISQTQAYQKIKKYKLFRIMLGGYMDQVQILHIQEKREIEEIKKHLYKTADIDDWKKEELLLRDYSGIILKEEGKRIDCKNLMFSSFVGSRIRYHLFTLSNLMGVNFSNSRIDDTAFIGNTFQQADFTGATLKNCDMHASMFFGGEYMNGQVTPGIYPVSFKNTVLDHVNFSYCDLRNCDFEHAIMTDVIMDSAILEGTRMSRENMEKLNLTEEQRNSIVIILE